MNVTLRCDKCDCRALVGIEDGRASPSTPEASWKCPLCGQQNKTSVIAQVVSVTCQCLRLIVASR